MSEVKSFCAWLLRRRYIKHDPAAELPRVRVPRYMPRALPKEAVARLLASLPDARSMVMCLLKVQEGLRCCEVSRLEIGDIDVVERTIRVRGKGGHERLLPLTDETWAAIQQYLAEHPATSGPLIRSYRSAWAPLSPDTISGLVAAWMRAAGIKHRARDGVSAHALRHTAATDMLRNGAHLLDVKHALGHESISTTQVYLPLHVKDLREAMGGRRYRGTA